MKRSLNARLWWLDRLNNCLRVLGAGFLWAALLSLTPVRNELFGLVCVAIALGYVTVAIWDARQSKRELRAMRRETMERRQVAGDGFAASPRNGNGKLP